jgi:type IV secretory pathway TraG/TraD family ATPase VirD4
MNYEEFKERLTEDLKQDLYERTGNEHFVNETNVNKLQNASYEALTIRPENSPIAVSLDVQSLFKEYEGGRGYEDICGKAVDIVSNGFANQPQFNIDDFTNYDVMKEKFKLAAGKTAKSILVSCGARLAPFDIAELREITAYDELALDTLGERKTALFLIMSDNDLTFNFLISMVYTQLFNLLCERADDVHHGRLPVHVRCLIDEAANIGQIPNLEKLVATIRSREISACLVLQARSQLKAIYKDHADTIVGNMDSQLFLGGSEPTTLKDLSQALGKETIDSYNTGETRGREQSHSMNYNKLGKELMSVDELAVMDGNKCILQLRGVRPFLSDKYDLTKHPNYKLTSDYDKKNYFDIEKFLNRKLKLNNEDVYDVVDADALGEEDRNGKNEASAQ